MKDLKQLIVKKLVDAADEELTIDIVLKEKNDFRQLALNSLSIIKWIVLLEDEFDIEIDIERVIVEEPILWSLDQLSSFIANEIPSQSNAIN
ncbi:MULTISPECIES: acyl carrier protein [Bacillus subtilis group]|uniref:acyl carrier protein n=1 Tax=Bacillus subtilis group TaxID=653685 RepID=UPI0022E71614|nr:MULTISPECIES: acyl carrier protein [Bacillus subtilis group]MEC1686922.1 acyl carrier protein [Bacillus mojavensis]